MQNGERASSKLGWTDTSHYFRPWQPLGTRCHWCVSLHSGSQPGPHLQRTHSMYFYNTAVNIVYQYNQLWKPFGHSSHYRPLQVVISLQLSSHLGRCKHCSLVQEWRHGHRSESLDQMGSHWQKDICPVGHKTKEEEWWQGTKKRTKRQTVVWQERLILGLRVIQTERKNCVHQWECRHPLLCTLL